MCALAVHLCVFFWMLLTATASITCRYGQNRHYCMSTVQSERPYNSFFLSFNVCTVHIFPICEHLTNLLVYSSLWVFFSLFCHLSLYPSLPLSIYRSRFLYRLLFENMSLLLYFLFSRCLVYTVNVCVLCALVGYGKKSTNHIYDDLKSANP